MRTLVWLSLLFSLTQAIIILSNRQMRQTFSMICFLSILEVAYFSNLEQSTIACTIRLPELLAHTALSDEYGELTWMQ